LAIQSVIKCPECGFETRKELLLTIRTRNLRNYRIAGFKSMLRVLLGLLDTLRTPAYYKYLSIDNNIFQDYRLVG
jgi:hypothetical protein